MVNSKEEFYTFFKKHEEFKENNEDYLSEIKDALKNGYQPLPNAKLSESQSALLNELSHFIEKKVSLLADKELLADIKISNGISDIGKATAALEQYKSGLLNRNRSFKDMVIGGAENMAEVSLLESATTFLEPHELYGAVREDLPTSSVMGKIEDSKKFKEDRQFSMQHQEKVIEMQKTQQAQNKSIQADIASLGQEFGVLDAMSKSMKFSDNIKSPDTSPDVSQKTPSISF
ncbi:hypothetical protein NF27_DP01610 [Candidatus Jidaibacter acanthamoeba]|uniref:Uncharacterized protein n=1 Tax=Candidatus Jidaibacter acanthamoebae TaxID=86105 RepID=A0A0C1MU49_9RICK|nr:hypothetical protein [Candidatus Jidaibacter acanthamoeba]KIE05617.1 hypothetical protein NF27_DP01610 [Candidatus Jidaibacter acanthamoeba]